MAVARHPVARIAPPAPAIISASRARVGSNKGEQGMSSQRGFRSGVLAASTPWLVRSDRPSTIVAPNRNSTAKESGAAGDITIVRPAAAALTS